MQIDNDLVVVLGDGEIVFDEPGLDDWTVFLRMDGKSLEEQADILMAKVKGVRNLSYRDGREVTLDDLKARRFSARFFHRLVQAWIRAVADGVKGEAGGKNATAG